MTDAQQRRENTIRFLGVLLSALTVRIFTAHSRLIVPEDTVHYIGLAQGVSENGLESLLSTSTHPLYPMLLAGTQFLTGDFLLAGRLLGILLGVVTVLAVTEASRLLFGNTVGFFTGMFAALSPYLARQAGEPLPEQLSVCAAALALYFTLRADRNRSSSAALLAGIFSGVLILTRPEGLIFPLGLALGLFIPTVWARHPVRTRILPLLLILGFTLVASPYWIALSLDNGYPTFSRRQIEHLFRSFRFRAPMASPVRVFPDAKPTRIRQYQMEKKLQSQLLDPGKIPTPPPDPKALLVQVGSTPSGPHIHYPNKQVGQSIHSTYLHSRHQKKWSFELPKTIFESGHPVLILLGLVGLVTALAGTWREGRSILVLSTCLQIALLGAVNLQRGYLSRRHALILAILLLPWSGKTFWAGARLLWSRLDAKKTRPAIWISFALILAILAGKTFQLKGTRNLPERRVGEWIATHASHPTILTNAPRIALYANAPYVRLPVEGGYARILQLCLESNIDLVAVVGEGYYLVERLVALQWLIPIDTGQPDPSNNRNGVALYRVQFPP